MMFFRLRSLYETDRRTEGSTGQTRNAAYKDGRISVIVEKLWKTKQRLTNVHCSVLLDFE